MKKKLIGLAVLAALVFCTMPWAAAQNSYSMTIVHQWEEEPLVGVTFDVYQVTTAEGTWTELFQDCTVELTEIEKKTASELDKTARELLEYTQEHGSQPTRTQRTDEQGIAVFTELEEGLYLVVGDTLTQENVQYEVSPFLILLTQDVTSYTKPEEKPGDNTDGDKSDNDNSGGGGKNPTPSDKDNDKNTSSNNSEKNNDSDSNQTGTSQTSQTTSNKKLPQTGQLWWPIPVMACGGILLFSYGWWIAYGKEEEKE